MLDQRFFNLCKMMDAKVKPEKKFTKKVSFGQNWAQYLYSYISESFARDFFLKHQRIKKL